jgi:hypothetical protein
MVMDSATWLILMQYCGATEVHRLFLTYFHHQRLTPLPARINPSAGLLTTDRGQRRVVYGGATGIGRR